MPLGSATRRGAVVECVPDQFMLEVVPIIPAPLERLDERRLQSLIQGAKKALFPCVRQYRRHNPKLELASDDGGNDEDLIGELREPAQSLRDCRAHVLGDSPRFVGRQPRDLRHEERVPASSRVNQLDHLGGGCWPVIPAMSCPVSSADSPLRATLVTPTRASSPNVCARGARTSPSR